MRYPQSLWWGLNDQAAVVKGGNITMLKTPGDKISFGKRKGTVIRTVSFMRRGDMKNETYYIVELDEGDSDYLLPKPLQAPDCFISMMLIHVGNIDENGEEINAR
jgi:hypothetical protein